MNRFLTILVIAFGFMITGCSTGRIASLNRKPNEAIIIANIQIKNGDSYLNNKWNFLLDERLWAKLAVWPDSAKRVWMAVSVAG